MWKLKVLIFSSIFYLSGSNWAKLDQTDVWPNCCPIIIREFFFKITFWLMSDANFSETSLLGTLRFTIENRQIIFNLSVVVDDENSRRNISKLIIFLGKRNLIFSWIADWSKLWVVVVREKLLCKVLSVEIWMILFLLTKVILTYDPNLFSLNIFISYFCHSRIINKEKKCFDSTKNISKDCTSQKRK